MVDEMTMQTVQKLLKKVIDEQKKKHIYSDAAPQVTFKTLGNCSGLEHYPIQPLSEEEFRRMLDKDREKKEKRMFGKSY